MTLTSIALLILLAIFLLIMEILFVPGMVLGIISVVLMIVGIIVSYKDYGTTVGTLVLAGTAVVTLAAVYLAFKSNMWKKIGVRSTMEGKANLQQEDACKIGDTGKTISRLNPIGKAIINNLMLEVQTQDGFIDEQKDIVVIKIQHTKIFVRVAE